MSSRCFTFICLIFSSIAHIIAAFDGNMTRIILEQWLSQNELNATVISLPKRNITFIDPNTFVSLSNLKSLYLNQNKISKLDEPNHLENY